MVNPLRVDGEAYVPDVNKNFTYCMMTVLKDMTNQKKYLYLEYVEFLEMLCRLAHMHWEYNKDKFPDLKWNDIEEITSNLLRQLFTIRKWKPDEFQTVKKTKDFPEYVDLDENYESDSD